MITDSDREQIHHNVMHTLVAAKGHLHYRHQSYAMLNGHGDTACPMAEDASILLLRLDNLMESSKCTLDWLLLVETADLLDTISSYFSATAQAHAILHDEPVKRTPLWDLVDHAEHTARELAARAPNRPFKATKSDEDSPA